MRCATPMMLAEGRRLRPSRAAVRVIRAVVGLLLIGVLVIEGVTLAGHFDTLADALAGANLGLVGLALALEVASWMAFAALFFFSSRRRHTRSLRDWSSDVCSSD